MKYEIKVISPSLQKIEVELTAEEFNKFYSEALKKVAAEAELPGFRKGKAPLNVVEERTNPAALLSEAGELAIRDTWLKILKESQLEAIASPRAEILKIAKDNPFIFSLEVEVLPKISLPDIRAISASVKNEEKIEVTDKEVEDSIEWLRQSRAELIDKEDNIEKGDMAEIQFEFLGASEKLPVGIQEDSFIIGKGHYIKGMEDALIGMKKNEEKVFTGEVPMGKKGESSEPVEVKVKVKNIKKVNLPEANDEWAKSLGNFTTLLELKEDIKKGILEEKEMAAREKKRAMILENICKAVEVDAPASLIARETDALLNNLKNRVENETGLSFAQYLEQLKKSEDDVRKEYEQIGAERVKAYLVLNQIEKDEKIEATESEIQAKIEEILKPYSDTDKERARQEIERSETKAYLADEIKREKIFKLLGA